MGVGPILRPTGKPLIGTTGRKYRLDLLQRVESRYGDRCIDSYMSDFGTRIAEAGGLPLNLTYDTDPDAVCEWLHGVVITGGQDLHPASWGGDESVVRGVDPRTDPWAHDPERDAYELALIRAALARGIPVLGVCRGLQILNVALGGTLIADLPAGAVRHLSRETAPTDGTADHLVTFEPGSIAAGLFNGPVITNSWHHQAVDRCGEGIVVTGRTSDGVVEAIEMPGAPVLAVQWHPEWMKSFDPTMAWIVEEAARRM